MYVITRKKLHIHAKKKRKKSGQPGTSVGERAQPKTSSEKESRKGTAIKGTLRGGGDEGPLFGLKKKKKTHGKKEKRGGRLSVLYYIAEGARSRERTGKDKPRGKGGVKVHLLALEPKYQ